MTTLSEYLKGSSLFTEINNITPIFSEVTPATLDTLLVYKYGERTVFEKSVTIDIETLALLIVTEYAERWENLITITSSDLDITVSGSDTTTETITTEEARNNSREDLNKVSAYDSDELIINDGSNSVGDDEMTGTKERVLKREKQDLAAAFSNLKLLEKNNIIDTVLKDVSSFMTLSIY